jgi:hypothetical protein
MRPARELHPDLAECVLEDRALLAYGPGLLGNAFFAYNPFSNQIVVPNSGGGSGPGGSTSSPGPRFYNLLLGLSLSSSGALGPSSGGTLSVFSLSMTPSTSLGAGNSLVSGRTGNGSLGIGGGGAGGGRSSVTSGFSSQFSSGFGFAIGSTNNYGMSPLALGSVPVHTYGGGGQPLPEGAETNDNGQTPMAGNEKSPLGPAPGTVNSAARGVDVNPRNNLLGEHPRGPANHAPQQQGPTPPQNQPDPSL